MQERIWRAATSLHKVSRTTSYGLKDGAFRRAVQIAAQAFLSVARPKVNDFSLSNYNVWLNVREDDATYRFCRDASYGYYFADFLESQQEPFVFIDVGANIGLYSLIALKNLSCLHTVSVEPTTTTLEFLRKNLQAQDRTEWTVLGVAISRESGKGSIQMPPGHSGASVLDLNPIVNSEARAPNLIQEEVEIFGATELQKIISLLPDVRIVAKVDVEGREADVVETLVRAIEMGRLAAAFIEFSGATDILKTEQMLKSAGLKEVTRVGKPSHYDGLWVISPEEGENSFY
jgi:FkbM family methyltransferase